MALDNCQLLEMYMKRVSTFLSSPLCILLLSLLTLSNCSSHPNSIEQSAIPTATLSLGDLASVDWIHGSRDCDSLTVDTDYLEWQSVQYHENSYIFRQNKCSHYEGPFVYLFIGRDSGLLIDSGATVAGGHGLLELVRSITDVPIVLAHTHGHSDHRLGDDAFRDRARVSVVETGAGAVAEHFGFLNWPNDSVGLDLGGREIQILAIPGHSDDDLAFYDPLTKVLVTGDTLYPGRLYVRNWSEYRRSIGRLADWVREKSVSMVLGTHIEMSTSANQDYPVGTTFQPEEHQLPLSVRDIYSLRAAMDETDSPERVPLGSYIIWPI